MFIYHEWFSRYQYNRVMEERGHRMLPPVPVKEKFQRILHLLSFNTQAVHFEPEILVIKQGFREADFMYIIQKGKCKVTVYDENVYTKKMEDIHVKMLGESDYFGEISLVYDGVRTANVGTTNYCTLGKLRVKTLHQLCANFPFFKKALLERMVVYDD